MTRIELLSLDNFVLYCFDDDMRLIKMYLDVIKSRYSSILYGGKNYNIKGVEYNQIFGIVFVLDNYPTRVAHSAITDIYE